MNLLFPLLGNTQRTLFMLIILGLAITVIIITHRIYDHGPIAVFALALMISAISMQIVALVLEHRFMWPPFSQYLSFFFGDLLLLPGVAVMIALKLQDLPEGNYWWRGTTWTVASIAMALALAISFRIGDQNSYTAAEFISPTKIWHDIFVYFVFSYFLLSNAPALIAGNWQPGLTLAAVALFIGWLALGAYDSKHPKPDAHIPYPQWLAPGEAKASTP